MTIASTISRLEYAGDGVTTAFATAPGGAGFYFNADADVAVYVRDDTTLVSTLQVITTNYLLTGEGDQSGGTVTMQAGSIPASGETLVILHDPETKQEVDLIVAGKFAAESLETGLDHAVHLAQRNRDLVDRAITLGDGDPTTGGAYDVGSNKLSNVTDPTLAQDAVTKAYIEALNLGILTGFGVSVQTGAYTLVLADGGTDIVYNEATAKVLTVPPNSEVDYPLGTTISFFCKGNGSIDITRGAGVSINLYNGVDAPVDDDWRLGVGGVCSIKQIADDEWVIFGNSALVAN